MHFDLKYIFSSISEIGTATPQGTALLVCPQKELWHKNWNIPGAGGRECVDPLV